MGLYSNWFFFSFQHLSRSFKPTDVWYENEHRELMQLDAPHQVNSLKTKLF